MIMPTFSSMAALYIVVMTTCGTTAEKQQIMCILIV